MQCLQTMKVTYKAFLNESMLKARLKVLKVKRNPAQSLKVLKSFSSVYLAAIISISLWGSKSEVMDDDIYMNNTKQYLRDLANSKVKEEELELPYGENPQDEFLGKIADIESAGGLYTDHKQLKNGIHAGTAAIGDYGLMPNTVKDIVKKVKNTKSELGVSLPRRVDISELQAISQLPAAEMKAALESDKASQLKLARLLAEELKLKQGDNDEKRAYSWNMGNNLTPNQITDQKLNKHPYVMKFRKLRTLLGKAD